ncbi:transposase [Caballeronia novacaledonica]|uniref:IS66 family transposase n=1 Tax=Caballeronia novacaledonica TaxID=1544861 RepID=UPI003857B708
MSDARPQCIEHAEQFERICALNQIGETISGRLPNQRCAYRQKHEPASLDRFHAWLITALETLSSKSDTSRGILYTLMKIAHTVLR